MSKNGLIMVVDDAETNRILLEAILEDRYHIVQAVDGEDALVQIYDRRIMPDMILLDIMMPNLSGLELLAILKSEPETSGIPVIFITAADNDKAELEGLNAGAVDYIAKPFVPDVVKLRVNNYMELLRYRKSLEDMVNKKVEELTETKDHMIETMATIIEYRNLESGQHVKRTTVLTSIMIKHMLEYQKYRQKLIDLDYNVILKAAPMHDIGKIAIPDNILLKPARLTPEEFEIVKTHTTVGGQIIESMMDFNKDIYFQHCHDIARYHHERWDGAGYPDKLSGDDIPLSARILSIVDVYDALTSERVYKKAFSHEEALNIIKQSSGTQFDPHLIEILGEIHEEFRECVAKYADVI